MITAGPAHSVEDTSEELPEREKGCVSGMEEVCSCEFGAGGEGVSGDGVTREVGITKQLHQLHPTLIKLQIRIFL